MSGIQWYYGRNEGLPCYIGLSEDDPEDDPEDTLVMGRCCIPDPIFIALTTAIHFIRVHLWAAIGVYDETTTGWALEKGPGVSAAKAVVLSRVFNK